MSGQPMLESFTRDMPIAQLQGKELRLLQPPNTRFNGVAAAGRISARSSRTCATVADDIPIIRSMVTEAINHDPPPTFMNTGTTISGRPAMGSWITYGLGGEGDDLPGFVVLTSDGKFGPVPADRLAAMAQRVPAQPLPGRAILLQGRLGALYGAAPGEPARARPAATSVDAVRTLDSIPRMRSSTTLRSRPGSPPMKPRSGCRPACPSSSIYATSPSTCWRCTVPRVGNS